MVVESNPPLPGIKERRKRGEEEKISCYIPPPPPLVVRGGEGILKPPLPPLRGGEGFFSRVEEGGGHWIVEEEDEDGRGCMSLAVVHKKGFFVPSPLLWGIVCRRRGHNTGNLAGYLWAGCVCV